MDVVELTTAAIKWLGRPSVDSEVWFLYDIASLPVDITNMGTYASSVRAADLGECWEHSAVKLLVYEARGSYAMPY